MPADATQRMAEALADVNVVRGPARRVVRGYALHEVLGRGAFGCVYHARREGGSGAGGGGEFALKELELEQGEAADGGAGAASENGQPGAAASSADAAAAVRREVLILAALSHPHIIRYHESFVETGRLYIVTELVDGASLLDHLTALREKGESLTEERVWQLFVQLLLALRYCHKVAGIVHRDVRALARPTHIACLSRPSASASPSLLQLSAYHGSLSLLLQLSARAAMLRHRR